MAYKCGRSGKLRPKRRGSERSVELSSVGRVRRSIRVDRLLGIEERTDATAKLSGDAAYTTRD